MIPIDIVEYDSGTAFEVGQRIQSKRIAMDLKAADVASYLNIDAKQLSRIENGNANCTIKHLYVLHQLLDCSIDYLLTGIEPVSQEVAILQDAMKQISDVTNKFVS